MTPLQKAIVGGLLVILGRALLYQLREASVLRAKVQTLERQLGMHPERDARK